MVMTQDGADGTAMPAQRRAELEGLATRLAAAWKSMRVIDGAGIDAIPATRREACFVQDRMAAALGAGLTGWKVGATSARMRELDGHDDVIPGRIFAPTTYLGNDLMLPISRFPRARIETEFAFRLSADVPLRDAPWTAGELSPLATLHPAFEIIGNRCDMGDAPPASKSLMTIADNGGGIGFVFGDAVADWQHIDFQNHIIDLSVDGGPPADNFLGDMRCVPIQALADLVNHLAGRGIGLAAGDFVSTGAATVPQPIEAGSHVVAGFGSLGVMRVGFE